MQLKFLIGIWLGFSISFLVTGYFEGEFNWTRLLALLLGATFAHFLLIIPIARKIEKGRQ